MTGTAEGLGHVPKGEDRNGPTDEGTRPAKHLDRQIGRRIRELRKQRGMTMVQFAERAGLSQSGMSYIENGVKGVMATTLVRLAEVLDVSPVELFMDESDRPALTQAEGPTDSKLLNAALARPEAGQLLAKIALIYLQEREPFLLFARAVNTYINRGPRGDQQALPEQAMVAETEGSYGISPLETVPPSPATPVAARGSVAGKQEEGFSTATIGRKIRNLRQTLGMTMVEVAERAGLSQAQLSRLENGKQDLRSKTLVHIAKVLNVKPVYFFIDESRPRGNGQATSAVYSLANAGELLTALKSLEFVEVAEKIAHSFFYDPDAFKAVSLAMGELPGE